MDLPDDSSEETAEDLSRAALVAARDLRKDRLALALRSGTSGPDRRRALGVLVETALVRAGSGCSPSRH